MTELRLLRMEPILARSMPSTAAASDAGGAVNCAAGGSAAAAGSVLAGKGAEASGFGVHSIRCSNGEQSVLRDTAEGESECYQRPSQQRRHGCFPQCLFRTGEVF